MQVMDLPLQAIAAPGWNANHMDDAMQARLRRSIQRFGLLVPLVVRETKPGSYETVGGAQRLRVLKEMRREQVPAVVVAVDDMEARLLSQALNHIAGDDNPGRRAELLREVLRHLPSEVVLGVLPETRESLEAISRLGQEDVAEHLAAWEEARRARLHHQTFELTGEELEVVRQALDRALASLGGEPSPNPNRKGRALVSICRAYLGGTGRKSYRQAYRRGT